MTGWDRVQELLARLDRANERIMLVFDAKNMWADRARRAEAVVARYDSVCPESLIEWAHRANSLGSVAP